MRWDSDNILTSLTLEGVSIFISTTHHQCVMRVEALHHLQATMHVIRSWDTYSNINQSRICSTRTPSIKHTVLARYCYAIRHTLYLLDELERERHLSDITASAVQYMINALPSLCVTLLTLLIKCLNTEKKNEERVLTTISSTIAVSKGNIILSAIN